MSTFFGVQLAFESKGREDLRAELGRTVREHRKSTNVLSQRQCWSRAAAAMSEFLPQAAIGTWDLLRDGGPAAYEEWASGLEAMAGWPDGDFGRGGSLVLVSAIFLVEAGSSADVTLGETCDIAETAFHDRATYARLVKVFPMLNFTQVQGSGLYIAPGEGLSGFERSVLEGEGFEYLRPVRG